MGLVDCNPCRARAKLHCTVCLTNQFVLVLCRILNGLFTFPLAILGPFTKLAKATTPTQGIVATVSTSSKAIDYVVAVANSCTTPPKDQKTMTKTILHRMAGELPPCQQCHHDQHHRLRHTMLRRGHKTMTTATPECATQDGVTCKPS